MVKACWLVVEMEQEWEQWWGFDLAQGLVCVSVAEKVHESELELA